MHHISKLPIAAYLNAEAVRRRPRGVDAYGKVLYRLERHAAGRALTPSVVADYLDTRAGLALTTISFEMTVIASFERWCRRRGYPIGADLLAYVERPRKTRRPPLEAPRVEVRKAAAWCQGRDGYPRSRRFVALALFAGLRFSEIRALDWGDVDMDAGRIRVRDGKGGQSREVPACPALRSVLSEVPPRFRTGAVAGLHDGRHLSIGGGEHIFDTELPRYGIHVTCHALRRAFATRIEERGASVRVIQELLGHSSLATTERYLGVDSGRKVEAVNLLDGDAWE